MAHNLRHRVFRAPKELSHAHLNAEQQSQNESHDGLQRFRLRPSFPVEGDLVGNLDSRAIRIDSGASNSPLDSPRQESSKQPIEDHDEQT